VIMAIFRDIEQRLENLVEGFFNHRFSSAIQPVELAKKLGVEMDRKRQVSVAHTYAPNVFMIHLAPDDFEALEGFSQALAAELAEYVKAHGGDRGYRFTGSVHVSLAPEADVHQGECAIHSHFEEMSLPLANGGTQIISARELEEALATTTCTYLINNSSGAKYKLQEKPLTIGRKSDNDIVISDPGVSRYHARVEIDGNDTYLVDLSSTNGTLINGEEISRGRLADDDIISVGNHDLTFRHETSD
jgi:hypothetical protein